jgi:hypothetical protein
MREQISLGADAPESTFMPVRKTESRIPAGFLASDLGEAIADSRCALVSFVTAPLAVARDNAYVLLVTDAGLASSVQSFEWSFTEDGGTPTVKTTEFGQIAYTPSAEGYLDLTVRLLDSGSSELARLSLTQQIGPLNKELEQQIADAVNKPGPGMGNTEVLRELVNDHNPYYLNVALKTPEAGKGFQKFLLSTVYDGALQRTPSARSSQVEQVAASLNTGAPDFAAATAPGLGVAAVRLSLAAMLLPPNGLPFTELPTSDAGNATADEQLRAQLATLGEGDRLDLFNLARFPKSNITLCGKLLEALRDKFFAGVNFDAVLTKMSGTMSEWILLNYNKGPLHRS